MIFLILSFIALYLVAGVASYAGGIAVLMCINNVPLTKRFIPSFVREVLAWPLYLSYNLMDIKKMQSIIKEEMAESEEDVQFRAEDNKTLRVIQ